jgi:hypothetical protein
MTDREDTARFPLGAQSREVAKTRVKGAGEPHVSRHDPAHVERTTLRKLRVLRMEVQNAVNAASHVEGHPFFDRLVALHSDVSDAIAAEEARLA